jgi:hypothetical protein
MLERDWTVLPLANEFQQTIPCRCQSGEDHHTAQRLLVLSLFICHCITQDINLFFIKSLLINLSNPKTIKTLTYQI